MRAAGARRVPAMLSTRYAESAVPGPRGRVSLHEGFGGDAVNAAPPTYHAVTSADGARISVRSVGSGPGVVLIPGAGRAAHHYDRLARTLASRFTVHGIDRRGRGDSDPQGDGYCLAREVDDVAAVLDATGARFVFGHSYGGLIGLEAARVLPVERLAVWEPAVSLNGSFPAEAVPSFAKAVAAGRATLAEAMVIKAVVGRPYDQLPLPVIRMLVALYMIGARGRELASLCSAMVPELNQILASDGDGSRFADVAADTLLLAGADSRPFLTQPPAWLARVIPHAQARLVPHVAHMAPDEQAPGRVGELVREFFSA